MVAAGDPIASTDVTTVEDYTIRKPLVKLVQQSAQSLADSTDTAITFGAGSEEIDTHGFHDVSSNTTRITPTIAGYYSLHGIYTTGARADYATIQVVIKKNGTTNLTAVGRDGPNATSSYRAVEVACLDSANGTTDYWELMGFQDNTTNAAQNTASAGTQTSCIFEAKFERPL